ncbi:cupin domain-containing protein [Haloarculaceae archaeon H-GB2-1]|nr:cupin domain-containing protein [Haloarculaceae archaeon H-GB1-1]MEA5407019.1 cupin domain-containing protein [Haloarculaceae archaeon H-GB2-1]
MQVNETDLEFEESEHGTSLARRKRLSREAGGEELGCSLYELPPGRRSWPYHYHENNEEALYVLDGAGTLRHDGDEHSLAAGDYVALPTGPEGGHRVVNDTETTLRYLAISTMRHPDVVRYPDSDKVGVYTGSAPGDHDGRTLTAYYRRDDDVDYWEGEE